MLDKIIHFSIHNRWFVLLAVVGVAVLGLYNFNRLPIDAVPDVTNVQVQVNTVAPGMSPLEIENQITFSIETAMGGIPKVEHTRSLSRYGLSQVTIVFEEGTDIYFARQLVNERLQEAKASLPSTVSEPEMGPISTGLGDIYSWTIGAEPGATKPNGEPYTPTDLREIQDWVIKPQLRTVPGVTEVNTVGGYEKQFHVTPDPARLVAYGLSFHDVMVALAKNNSSVGAGYIEHKGEQYLIRVPGLVSGAEDIRNIIIGENDGTPVFIRDVANVELGKQLRTGAATENGEEVVLGSVFMLMGENSRAVSKRVDAKMSEVNKTLPDGIIARTVKNRTRLVDATLKTVRNNLLEGAILVIAILFALLGNLRAALLVSLTIPLSMLFAVTGMVQNKVSGNLMSLGAIDFGIIVDGAVVMVENIIRRFSERQQHLGRLLTMGERLEEAFESAREVSKPTLFGVAIIMIVYLPILTLGGIEGKMFIPMAETVLLALGGALVLTFTFIPAGIALFLGGKISEKESIVIRAGKRVYTPLLEKVIEHRWMAVTIAFAFVVFCTLVASRMGSEFIPQLDEGDALIQSFRIPSTSLTQSIEMQKEWDKAVLTVPEVERVFSQIGTQEIATDPMPPSMADGYVIMKPRHEWPNPRKPKAELLEDLERAVDHLSGNAYEFTQPIQMRFNELIAGVRSDLAVKVFGDDLNVMLAHGEKIAAILRKIRGAEDVKVEQVKGLPLLTIEPDRAQIARYGLNIAEVQEVIEAAVGGAAVGQVFEGDRRFDLVVRLPEDVRRDVEALEFLPVPLPDSKEDRASEVEFASFALSGDTDPGYVPLGAIAKISIAEGPNQISRENGKRRVVVQSNVRGRDIGSFVAEAQTNIDANVKLPAGYWMTWGGQFENLIAAKERLLVVVPIALLLIFLLLFATFNSLKDSALVFTGIPLALTGGILTLWFRGIPLSISAGVGFIALSGIAVLNGLIMISFINKLREEGVKLEDAIKRGALTRLRPVLMTALVASLGFVPMAIATGSGAEVQRPLATVVIGGILSSTFLTLLVLPALYRIFHRDQAEEHQVSSSTQS
ncbi:MAG: CusA/CzcA family heavy metal efflux RND transporter [Candidatus Zixiibacteriota bacterium]